jgi:GT2 family glycosyltransferase
MLYFYSTRKKSEENRKKILNSLKTDVKVVEFENDGQYSLTQAYNKALDMCGEDEILILAHDDIILPHGWDEKIKEIFETTDYGIIGLAGSTSLSKNAIWWENRADLAGIISHEREVNGKMVKYDSEFSSNHDFVMNVCVLDGVFIALKKNRIKKNFNEKIKGFHFYDICFSVENFLEGVKIGVTTSFKIHHKSIGQVPNSWYFNRNVFLEMYGDALPIQTRPNLTDIAKVNPVQVNSVSVGVVILTKNKIDYLIRCINSLIKKTSKNIHLNIVVGDTGSSEESLNTLNSYVDQITAAEHKNVNLRVHHLDYYNFAKNNNELVKTYFKDEELLLFCNNDIQLINNALDLMVLTYQKNKQRCGTIGCRLLYPNLRVQHAGIILYVDKSKRLGASHYGLRSYYSFNSKLATNMVGSTGAFLLVNKKVFEKVNGFNEKTTECFEDVVLNIDTIALLDKTNFYQGDAVCYHHESLTRDESPDMLKRLNEDFVNVLQPKILEHKSKLKNFIIIL